MTKVFLKEDGSLDLRRIKSLPLEKRLKMVAEMTECQYLSYIKTMPINEGKQLPIKAVVVDYSFQDYIDRGKGVEAFGFLKELKENILKMR